MFDPDRFTLERVAQRPKGAVSAATTQAESLAAKIDPSMLQGLTSQDRANIRNFTLP